MTEQGAVAPVICSACRGPMVRSGWHLVCAAECGGDGSRLEWVYGPTKRVPVEAFVTTADSCGPALIGYTSVPDLEARAEAQAKESA